MESRSFPPPTTSAPNPQDGRRCSVLAPECPPIRLLNAAALPGRKRRREDPVGAFDGHSIESAPRFLDATKKRAPSDIEPGLPMWRARRCHSRLESTRGVMG